MIPLDHVYALLRSSTALINPSRFEGWSTTVEEAKSFGVPMILSDLDVHREQTGGAARYFGINDPEMLADHLSEVSQAGSRGCPRSVAGSRRARRGVRHGVCARRSGCGGLTAAFCWRMAGKSVCSIVRLEYGPRRDVPQQNSTPSPCVNNTVERARSGEPEEAVRRRSG